MSTDWNLAARVVHVVRIDCNKMSTLSTMRLQICSNQEELKAFFRHGQKSSLPGIWPAIYGKSALALPNDQVCLKTSSGYTFKDETDQTAAESFPIPAIVYPSVFQWSSEARSAPACLDSMSGSSTVLLPDEVGSRKSLSFLSEHSELAPIWQPQVENVNEAYLLRHFQRHLADWLDAGNTQRQFSTDVARRATQFPLLLYACIAVAACHLSRTAHAVSPDLADKFHERCISIILAALHKPVFDIEIDILLSSTVILRFLEQISSNTPSNDPQCHLLAGSVYFSANVDNAISGGLSSASFWAFVVQDIQSALTHQKRLKLDLELFDDRLRRLWASTPALSDGDWVNRAIWLLAKTINSCFNVTGSNFGHRLDFAGEAALKQKIGEWELEVSEAVRPLHVSPPDPEKGIPFPIIWYNNLAHSTAMQHICLAKALVLIREYTFQHSMSSPEKQLHLKEQISGNLDYLFGIALSAGDEPSLRVMACHALCACSAWIDDRVARNSLFNLLRRTERETGWPWAYVEQRVLRTWQGGSREEYH